MFAIAIGIAFLVIVAIGVGIMDAVQAASWRQVARERRQQWEARQPVHHGVDDGPDDSWDEDDD